MNKGISWTIKCRNILSRYRDVVLLNGKPIHHCAKDASFASMSDFPDIDIKFWKFLYVLNCCSERPGVFSLMKNKFRGRCEPPIFFFHHYENIRSFCFQKHIFPEHVKTCTSSMNVENSEKEKLTTWKSLVTKSYSILVFHSEY